MKNIRLISVVLKGYGFLLFAEILCLFLNLTLAVSPSNIFKIIAAFCTAVIFIGIICNHAHNTAKNDKVLERQFKTTFSGMRCILAGFSMTALYVVIWVFLLLSKLGFIGDFYNEYKLINGQYLQLFNLIWPGTEIADVSMSGVLIMLSFTIVPFVAFVTAYKLTYKGVDIESIQYSA